jgi:hypothetical protein
VDAALQDLLVGLASNGLTELFLRGTAANDSTPDLDAASTAVESAMTQLTEVETIIPSLGSEDLRVFLKSAETYNVVRQIFASTQAREIDVIEKEFYALWQARVGQHEESSREEVGRLFRTLVRLCQISLDRAIAAGNLTAIEARAAQRHAEVLGSLEGLQRTVQFLSASTHLSSGEVDEFAAKYRRQVAAREGSITPPALDSARQYPIDSLYVPARLSPVESSANPISYKEFGSTLFRRVVLGNPGSGKSTLAKKLAADVARDKLPVTGRSGGLVPFLVVLRDFGAHKREVPCSILDFIASTSNSRYQVAPPSSAIEYLLVTQRAVVIFDGLDELLDTSYRAEISGDVESFANLYPGVPIMVTSREVGYSQAPLSPQSFTTYQLAAFSESEVREYARNWFAVADKGWSGEAEEQVEEFMGDSAAVSDLRSNALMLGLMCNLYKGSGYIPRNRPDVYEACAVMLFDRWDRLRKIGKPLSIESLLRPTMQHLAAWIYSDPELQSGVTERDLIQAAADFLLGRRFQSPEEAELEASRFIEFCRGRAWVFTDTGTTPAGERLYQFTHRTFLEFFTAGDLVRKNPSAAKLFSVLDPHIADGEWDVVAQLSFQLLEHNIEGAADALLTLLLEQDGDLTSNAQQNRLDFAARSLEFLVPSPAVVKRLVKALWLSLMDSLDPAGEVYQANHGFQEESPRVRSLLSVIRANPENYLPIKEAVLEGVETYLTTPSLDSYAAELALNLPRARGLGRKSDNGDLANDITRQLLDDHKEQLVGIGEENWRLGSDLVLLGVLPAQQHLEKHGLQTWLLGRSFRPFPNRRRFPLAEIVTANLLWEYENPLKLGTALESLTALAKFFEPSALSKITSQDLGEGWLARGADSSFPFRNLDSLDLSNDQVFSLLVLLAMLFGETAPRDDGAVIKDSSALAHRFNAILTGRASDKARANAEESLTECSLSKEQQSLIQSWIQGRPILVSS